MTKTIEGKVLRILDEFAGREASAGYYDPECAVTIQTEFETFPQKIIRSLPFTGLGDTREQVVVEEPDFREGQIVELEVERPTKELDYYVDVTNKTEGDYSE